MTPDDRFDVPPPVSLVLLACLALPIAFVAFGIGTLRFAAAEMARPAVDSFDGGICLGLAALTGQAFCRLDAPGAVPEKAAEAVVELHGVEARSASLREEIRHAEERAQELRRALEESQGVDVNRVYGRFSRNGVPQWVECRDDGVVLQPQNSVVTIDELRTGSDDFVAAVEARQHAVFLIRPEGYASFEAARKLIEAKHLPIGFEPIDAHWKLRF